MPHLIKFSSSRHGSDHAFPLQRDVDKEDEHWARRPGKAGFVTIVRILGYSDPSLLYALPGFSQSLHVLLPSERAYFY